MFEIIKEKRKYKKYKQIIFVDGENVGYRLKNTSLPNDMYFFVFTTNNISHLGDNVEMVNVRSIRNNVSNTSNCLDFCLISHVSEIISLIKEKEIIILSKDGGYDSAILYLKQKYPHLHIARYGKSIEKYLLFYKNNEYIKTLPEWINLSDHMLNKIGLYDNMNDLKKNLSPNQKKKFVYSFKVVPISNICIHITYDIYTHLYKVNVEGGCCFAN